MSSVQKLICVVLQINSVGNVSEIDLQSNSSDALNKRAKMKRNEPYA